MGNALHPLFAQILSRVAEPPSPGDRLRAILAAYERAKTDPHAKLPSYLMAALEAAKQ